MAVGLGVMLPSLLVRARPSNNNWTPQELGSDLALWLDASDASTITESAGLVSQWDDKSGNGNHVSNTTASTQPDYLATGWNGNPTISFARIGYEVLFKAGVSNFAANGDFTIASAFEFLQSSSNYNMVAGWRSAPSFATPPNRGAPVLQQMASFSKIGYYATDISPGFISVDVTSPLGKKIATIGRSGGVNGQGGAATVTCTGFSQATYITNTTQGFTSAAATGFQIGGASAHGVTSYGNKYVSEVVGCNAKLSTSDREKLEGYLAWKWGVEGDLPSAHPYKNAAPTA